jgi:hypothetical protein
MFDELAESHRLVSGAVDSSPWVALHEKRESMVRASIEEMVQWLNSHITEPAVLEGINWTPEETLNAPVELARIKAAKAKSSSWVDDFVTLLKESDAEHGEERTNRKVLRLAHEAFNAKAQYPKANHDQWLYSFSAKSAEQPIDWFIRALKAKQS